MKTMIMFAFSLPLLAACAMEVGGDDTESEATEALDEVSEVESALATGSVSCTGSYVGRGICTASPPSGWTGTVTWTIGSSIFGAARITSTGPLTASWSCTKGSTARVTANGIGSTTVRCTWL